jgi:hypothetical protein
MFTRRIPLGVLGTLLALLSSVGCVERRLMIRTNPVGASVKVDDYEVGTTPCAINYTYYGTRKLKIEKPGFETLTVLQPVPAPWYQIPPIDFVSEVLVPWQIRDQRTLEYQLVPQVVVPNEHLQARGEDLRRKTQGGVPVGAMPGINSGPPSSPFLGPGPVSPLESVAPRGY